MNEVALFAVLGALVLALPAFFIFGRRSGMSAGQRTELERQRAAKSSAEEISKRLVDEAEREANQSMTAAMQGLSAEVRRMLPPAKRGEGSMV